VFARTSSSAFFLATTDSGGPKDAIFSMNNGCIGAINDRCLQVPDLVNGGNIFLSQQYHVVLLGSTALSPFPSSLSPSSFPLCRVAPCSRLILFVGETVISQEWGRIRKIQGKLWDIRNAVFMGEVFAKMLAGILHEEFYH
jgi:hypothetical protein